jgi:hypothetical protein
MAQRMKTSRRLNKVFERAGADTVRALLLNTVANRADLPSELARLSEPSEERRAAIRWLRKKERAAKTRAVVLDMMAIVTMIAACMAAVAAWPVIKEVIRGLTK